MVGHFKCLNAFSQIGGLCGSYGWFPCILSRMVYVLVFLCPGCGLLFSLVSLRVALFVGFGCFVALLVGCFFFFFLDN